MSDGLNDTKQVSPTMKIEFPCQSNQCLYCGHVLPSHYSFCSLALPMPLPESLLCSCQSGPLPYTDKNVVFCYKCKKPLTTSQLRDIELMKPKSETLAPGVEQVPFIGIEAIGAIFNEGATKYGVDNWKQDPSNKEYNIERSRHAIRHLMLWANGDRSEPHLAKVAWFCVTTIWREDRSKPTT